MVDDYYMIMIFHDMICWWFYRSGGILVENIGSFSAMVLINHYYQIIIYHLALVEIERWWLLSFKGQIPPWILHDFRATSQHLNLKGMSTDEVVLYNLSVTKVTFGLGLRHKQKSFSVFYRCGNPPLFVGSCSRFVKYRNLTWDPKGLTVQEVPEANEIVWFCLNCWWLKSGDHELRDR